MVDICVSTPMDYKAASSGEDLGVAVAALFQWGRGARTPAIH